jgi:uncharacterized protein YbcI
VSGATPTSPGALSSVVSNFIVRLFNVYAGRGPVRARAYIGGDLVCVILEDTLTRGEMSLVKDGQVALVLMTRRGYQDAMRKEAIAGIEDLTGRTVKVFMSDNHIDPDIAVECFVLEPEGD